MIAWMLCVLCAAEPAYESTSNYKPQRIEGWTIYVNHRLLDEKVELGRKTLELLRVKLYDINRTVPQPALAKLHGVRI